MKKPLAENQADRASYCVALAEQARDEMFGPKRKTWLDRLEQEYSEIQAALRWFVEQGEAKQGLRLVIGLREFWLGSDHIKAGRNWLETFLAHPQVSEPSKLRAQGLDDLAALAFWQNDKESVRALTLEALAMRRSIDDKQGLVVSLIHAGNFELMFEKNPSRARSYYEERQVILQELYGDRGVHVPMNTMGNLALLEGDYTTANRLLRQALEAQREEEELWVINYTLDSLAGIAANQGDPKRALRLAGASEALRSSMGIIHSPVARAWVDEILKPAWQALEPETANETWAEGLAMTWEHAVSYALENPS
jgi:hypothetical protein